MKKFIFLISLVLITLGGHAMIQTLSLSELAADSDIIAFASVVAIKNTGKTPQGVDVVANLVRLEEPLKGNIAAGEKVKIKTFAGVEDNVAFDEGQRYLLFLKKHEDFYFVTNQVQGSWPVEKDGKFAGMGTGKTLEDVKSAIETKPINVDQRIPDLQL
ncbi:MAG: hypothetical protein ACQETH_06115 [Candidatus Rifleibacteriota bacterium]